MATKITLGSTGEEITVEEKYNEEAYRDELIYSRLPNSEGEIKVLMRFAHYTDRDRDYYKEKYEELKKEHKELRIKHFFLEQQEISRGNTIDKLRSDLILKLKEVINWEFVFQKETVNTLFFLARSFQTSNR